MRFFPGKSYVFVIIWMVMGFFSHAQEVIFPFVENGKIGYRDSTDQVRLVPQFDYIEEFLPGQEWAVVGVGHYDLLNRFLDRKELNFTGKLGLIGRTGNFIFEPVFDIILSIGPEYAIVGSGNGYIHFEDFPQEKNYKFKGDLGVVNILGDTLVPLEYQTIQTLTHDKKTCWLAGNQNGDFFYSTGKKTRLGENIVSVDNFSDGLARFKTKTGNYGFMNTEGLIIIAPIYTRATHFEQGRAWVKKQDEYFFIDREGVKVDSSYFKFDEIAPFSDGLALVRMFDEYGYILPDSTFFVRPEFSEAGNFFNGITHISTEDSFGYIHKDGRRDMVLRYERDPVIAGDIRKNEPEDLKRLEKIPCKCCDSTTFNVSVDSLDISEFISIHMEALRWAPYLYYKYPQMLARVSAGEGTLAGRYDFNFSFLNTGSEPWENFKKKVLFVILGDNYFRSIAWEWLEPYYKKIFHSMPEQHRKVYRQMIQYLLQYFEKYSKDKVEQFLKEHPDRFAYQHWDGSTSPYRKVSAALERLIFIHQVMDLEDVQHWIRKIRDEMKNL